MKMIRRVGIFILASLILVGFSSFAFANDPKDYIAGAPGTTAILFYYNHTTGNNYYKNGDKIDRDTNLNANVGIFRGVHWMKAGPFTWDINVLFPFGELSLDGSGVGNSQKASSQIGDPILVFTLWGVDNPASKTWLAISEYFTFPVGEYDNNKILNMGGNRWAFKTEVAALKGFGNFHFDFNGSVEFYTNNKDYTTENLTLKKDPAYQAEVHLAYDWTKTFFTSVDYIYNYGGETRIVGGDSNNDKQNDHTAGVTLGYMVNSSTQLLLSYKDKFITENGVGDSKTLGFRVAYFW